MRTNCAPVITDPLITSLLAGTQNSLTDVCRYLQVIVTVDNHLSLLYIKEVYIIPQRT